MFVRVFVWQRLVASMAKMNEPKLIGKQIN